MCPKYRVLDCAVCQTVLEVSCVGLFRMLDSVCRKCCRQCRTAVPSYARLADVERDDGALARHRRRQQRVVASGPQVRPRDARTPPPPSRRGGNGWTKYGVEIPPREGKGPAWRRLTPLPPSRGGGQPVDQRNHVLDGAEKDQVGPGDAGRRHVPGTSSVPLCRRPRSLVRHVPV